MKRETGKWVRKAEQDWVIAQKLAKETQPPRDGVCFHCQQAAEKYIKALLQEGGFVVPRTHDLDDLVARLLPTIPNLKSLRRKAGSLTRYAVDFRYPGEIASKRQMEAALRNAERIRGECRGKLGLPAT